MRRYRASLSNLGLSDVRAWLMNLQESRGAGPYPYLVFEEMGGERFVQFRREVGAAGAVLSCHFPRAPWSEDYIAPLQALLAAKSIPFRQIEGRGGEPVTGFIVIENLQADDAADLADAIFCDIFGRTLSARVFGEGVKGRTEAGRS
jgi:hypothetical protein